MSTETKARKSNFELLRIVTMIGIVTAHILAHCINGQFSVDAGYFTLPILYKKIFILDYIMLFAGGSNSLFIMLSGYFLVEKGSNVNLVNTSKKLLIQLAFATVVLMVGSLLWHTFWANGEFIQLSNLTYFNNEAWFIGYYFIVIVIGRVYLNQFLCKLDKTHYLEFLLIIFALIQFNWSVAILEALFTNARIVLQGIFVYSTGGFIKKFNPFEKVKTIYMIGLILVIVVVATVSQYNIRSLAIEQWLAAGGSGPIYQSIYMPNNATATCTIIAIIVFDLFRRLPLGNVNIINQISKGVFMVYLIHDNQLFYNMWNKEKWIALLSDNPLAFVGLYVVWILKTFAIGFAVYILYILLEKIIKSLFRKR